MVIYAVLVNETENREPVRKTGMEMPRFEGRKILLVEDNELNQEIATELIAMTGASVESVENGQAAIENSGNSLKTIST